jgi:hypothetical protein
MVWYIQILLDGPFRACYMPRPLAFICISLPYTSVSRKCNPMKQTSQCDHTFFSNLIPSPPPRPYMLSCTPSH